MQLTQLNSVQPISAKQLVSRVFVYLLISTVTVSVLFSINFSSKFFTPKFHLPANSSKHVIYDVMTYKLSQLGHDVQN